MRAPLSLAALVCFAMFAVQNAYAGPPYPLKPTLQFDEKSPYALVIFAAEPQLRVPSWNLELLSFAPETRTWTYSILKGWGRFEAVGALPERSFHAALVKPDGIYAINNLNSQGYWHTCFNGGTKSFAVAAGKVTYIGVIDPNPALEQISTELPKKTKQVHLVIYDTPRLNLIPPSLQPDWNAEVTRYLAANFPKVTAPVVAAELAEATFEPGHSIIAGKICQKY